MPTGKTTAPSFGVSELPAPGDYVVLLHGLWRTRWSLRKLAAALHAEGFHTINLGYPSQFADVRSIVQDHIAPAVAHLCPDRDRQIHFVTHSLGGIVVRHYLTTDPPGKIGRCVFLATPNNGSRIVDWLAEHHLLRRPLGPVGEELHSAHDSVAKAHGPPRHPTLVIMGDRPLIPIFRPLLPGAHDGIVEVSAGLLPGAAPPIVVHADHTNIMNHPEVIHLTTGFIKTGRVSRRPLDGEAEAEPSS